MKGRNVKSLFTNRLIALSCAVEPLFGMLKHSYQLSIDTLGGAITPKNQPSTRWFTQVGAQT